MLLKTIINMMKVSKYLWHIIWYARQRQNHQTRQKSGRWSSDESDLTPNSFIRLRVIYYLIFSF